MRVASIDLGSNSFLCLIAEVDNAEVTKVLCDKLETVRLGQGLAQNQSIHPEALQRAESCLKRFKEIIDDLQVDEIRAVATSAARDAKNGDRLLEIGKKYNIDIEIIDGKREAELTYLGAKLDNSSDNYAVIDVGGGSTEIIFNSSKGLEQISLDIGAVRLTELFISQHPYLPDEEQVLSSYIREQLSVLKQHKINMDKLIAVAGTPTTLALMIQGLENYAEDKLNSFSISSEQLGFWFNYLKSMDLSQRKQIKGLDSKRADIIVAGIMILKESLSSLERSELLVSTRGVRYGLAKSIS